jgi:glyoxylase-like metal-dependent hydrolase (beta-lactamase superfamily II)
VIPLEDNTDDIIGKARRGLGYAPDVLAKQAGLTKPQARALETGEFTEEVLRKVAPVLRLGADALVRGSRKEWYPEQPGPIGGFLAFNTTYEDMTVNAYLVWDQESRKAVVFDTGADCAPILAAVKEHKLAVELVLLTHAHVDHVVDLPKLLSATKAKAWINSRDADEEDFPKGVETFSAGQSFVLGKIRIETRLTNGHSAGQTTFVVRGLERLIAIVGDSLFAGSMGGGKVSYADQLRTNKQEILTLPDDTVLAPGHGPLTTVAQEKANNPFFTGN